MSSHCATKLHGLSPSADNFVFSLLQIIFVVSCSVIHFHPHALQIEKYASTFRTRTKTSFILRDILERRKNLEKKEIVLNPIHLTVPTDCSNWLPTLALHPSTFDFKYHGCLSKLRSLLDYQGISWVIPTINIIVSCS